MKKAVIVSVVILLVVSAQAIAPLWAAVVATNTYDVAGNTLEEVQASIDANGPGGYAGRADPVLKSPASGTWTSVATSNSACAGGYSYQVTATSTISWSVETTILLPKWTGYASACKELKDEWDRFLSRLTVHERGHDTVAVQALADAKPLATINGVGSDCVEATAVTKAQADAQAKLNTEHQRVENAINAAGDKYDTDQDHGANQGATLNTAVVCGSIGGIVVPVDKQWAWLGLYAPYIGLTSTVIIGAVAMTVYARHVKRKKRDNEHNHSTPS